MRFLLVACLAGLCALSSSASVDSTNFAQKQKDVFRLFKFINQPSYYKDHQEIAKTFNLHDYATHFTKPEIFEEFSTYHKYEMFLNRGEIFSVFHEEHLHQAQLLFKLFYYADSYETMYKTAVWARNHMNEGLFLYSFSVALVHRPDTFFIVLPPIYEIYPHYFFNTEVIHQAQYFKQMYNGQKDSQFNQQTIFANYSGHYLNLHPEQSMSYFTEDIGINSFYYYYQLYYPFWMNTEEYNMKYDNTGEFFFHMYKQILARFYMERLSYGFGEIEWFNWEVPFETGYYPSLRYPNGLEFPSRPNFAKLSEYFYTYGQKWSFKNAYGYSYTFVQDYEKRIRDAVAAGYLFDQSGQKVDLFTENGLNTLGHVVEGVPDSPYYHYVKHFQSFARHLLGYAPQEQNIHKTFPSALEHFETSMRDPAFYMLYKKLMMFYMQYKKQQTPYKYHDLVFEGVKVKNVEFTPLVTFFDHFYSDITNAVYVTPEEFIQDDFKVQVSQERLNHKEFTYKVYVDSEQETEAVVKVFMGPKFDEYGRKINLSENWMNFIQFDHFTYHLKSGENVISRNSKEIVNYMHDRNSYSGLYKKASGAYEDGENFGFYGEQIWFGFPQRFMLPAGGVDGTTFQFYVMVTKMVPYKGHGESSVPMVGNGVQYVDGYPMGYPFDRFVQFEQVFEDIPNGYFYDAEIYHKDDASHVVDHEH